MDFFGVLRLVLGLSFFLFGMYVMSRNLEEIAGGRLEFLLKKATRNPLRGLLLGTGVTMAVQSSSAVTVLLVGLVGAGLITVAQTVPVIFGANIGTTLTAWLLSLSGLEGDHFWVRLLKPENFSPLLSALGIIFLLSAKHPRTKRAGEALLGFAVLMTGMDLMKEAVAPLADSKSLAAVLVQFKNPLLGVLAGAVVTALIQSSSASVGILQALSLTGSVTRSMAVPLVMGQNIGTCVTALISGVGSGKNARRVAMIHLLINLLGTVFGLLFYWVALRLFPTIDRPIQPVGIAVVHTLFNVMITVLLFPFSKQILRLTEKLVQ
jgi:phosphate:Na+ symporter